MPWYPHIDVQAVLTDRCCGIPHVGPKEVWELCVVDLVAWVWQLSSIVNSLPRIYRDRMTKAKVSHGLFCKWDPQVGVNRLAQVREVVSRALHSALLRVHNEVISLGIGQGLQQKKDPTVCPHPPLPASGVPPHEQPNHHFIQDPCVSAVVFGKSVRPEERKMRLSELWMSHNFLRLIASLIALPPQKALLCYPKRPGMTQRPMSFHIPVWVASWMTDYWINVTFSWT